MFLYDKTKKICTKNFICIKHYILYINYNKKRKNYKRKFKIL